MKRLILAILLYASFLISKVDACDLICPSIQNAACDILESPKYSTFQDFIDDGGTFDGVCEIDANSFYLMAVFSNGGLCPEILTRTYTIQDVDGNSYNCEQAVIINDDVEPVISCPQNETYSCIDDVPELYLTFNIFEANGGTAFDDCDLDTPSFYAYEIGDGGVCPTVYTREYRISDICGNSSQCDQTIVVGDYINPFISCPDNIIADGSIIDFPPFSDVNQFLSEGGSVSDNCDLNLGSFSLISELWDGLDCPGHFTRVYSILDLCDNYADCTRTIVLNKVFTNTIAISSCTSYNSPSGNYTWTESGTYEDVLVSHEGCDSVITIELWIEDGMISSSNSGEPGSLKSNLACASSLDTIVIPSDMGTLAVLSPLIVNDNIVIRSLNIQPAVIRFDFLNEELMLQHFGLKISSGVNVTLENVILEGENRSPEDQIILNNGNLKMSGIVKVKN